MTEIGQTNTLEILRITEHGAFLDGDNEGDILLPRRFLPAGAAAGDRLTVFLCYDSEDRLIATTQTPFVEVGSFASLEVVATSRVGAFLDWGLPKDLLLPFAEQTRELEVGQKVVVTAYLDSTGRIAASMRLNHFLKVSAEKAKAAFREGQEVNILVYGRTDLGYKAIVDQKFSGLLFENEVFQKIIFGEPLKAKVKKVREDGKLDLSLSEPLIGHKAVQDGIGPKILQRLQEAGGFLGINDKTDAEKIYELFGVSKKKYKIALGALYKARQIHVEEDGIFLVPPSEAPSSPRKGKGRS